MHNVREWTFVELGNQLESTQADQESIHPKVAALERHCVKLSGIDVGARIAVGD
jgi:hypothetical protein